MTIITDHNLITNEVILDTNTLTISLNTSDGIDFNTLYQYVNDDTIIKQITEDRYELLNGWTFTLPSDINQLRNGGFAVRNLSGNIIQQFACIITFGNIGEEQQVYYTTDGFTISNFSNLGHVNQCVEISETINNITVYVRDYINTFDMCKLSDIGLSKMTYQTYRFPLYSMDDMNIVYPITDAELYGITITYGNVTKDIDGTIAKFNVVIDGNGKTANEIYEATKSLLLKEYSIDANDESKVGKLVDELLYYEGEILTTKPGVFIENFDQDDINSIEFYDINNILRTYKYIASGIFIFNESLYMDPNAHYMLFYTNGWGTENAVQVMGADGLPIAGEINQSKIYFTYDYDNDTNGGGKSKDKNVTLVAIGLDTGQYIKSDKTITRTKENIFRMNAVKELSYKT